MKAKIVPERLRELYKLYKAKGETQDSIANDLGMTRSTFCQMCNDNYQHAQSEGTIKIIADYFHVDPKYLTGESDYMNLVHFVLDAGKKFSEAASIGDMLVKLGIVSLTDDNKYMRLSAKGNNDSIFIDNPTHIDMNEIEYSFFLAYLAEQIRSACDNYVKISVSHDTYGKHEYDNYSNFDTGQNQNDNR